MVRMLRRHRRQADGGGSGGSCPTPSGQALRCSSLRLTRCKRWRGEGRSTTQRRCTAPAGSAGKRGTHRGRSCKQLGVTLKVTNSAAAAALHGSVAACSAVLPPAAHQAGNPSCASECVCGLSQHSCDRCNSSTRAGVTSRPQHGRQEPAKVAADAKACCRSSEGQLMLTDCAEGRHQAGDQGLVASSLSKMLSFGTASGCMQVGAVRRLAHAAQQAASVLGLGCPDGRPLGGRPGLMGDAWLAGCSPAAVCDDAVLVDYSLYARSLCGACPGLHGGLGAGGAHLQTRRCSAGVRLPHVAPARN